MKTLLLALAFCSLSFVEARADFHDSQIIYDIGDDGVATIASRLGLRYEERGIGENQLGRGRHAFSVSVPDAGDEGGGPISSVQRHQQALVLRFGSDRKHFSPEAIRAWNASGTLHVSTADAEDGVAGLTTKLFLADGVTFRTALSAVSTKRSTTSRRTCRVHSQIA